MEREFAAEFLIFNRVGDGEGFVPAKVLFRAERICFLSKAAASVSLWRQAGAYGVVECLFEGNTALPHQAPNDSLGVGVESDRGPHGGIIASFEDTAMMP